MRPSKIPRNENNLDEKKLLRIMFICAILGILASLIFPLVMR